MAKLLRTLDEQFEAQLHALKTHKFENDPEVTRIVSTLIEDVRARGDQALIEATVRLDKRPELTNAAQLSISKKQLKDAYESCDESLRDALHLAAKRITEYHTKQKPQDNLDYIDDTGTRIGFKWSAMDSAGIYVPGGTASYPSSVLMNAIPAKVAGVKRIVMVVPAPADSLSPLVLAAAYIADIAEIYTVGGAQAIAALALGTETIKPVDVIVGPGNAYVANAKKQLFGTVGIDMIAGPSEICVVADKQANASWVAADLLSQAEHDTAARSILVTDDEDFAQRVIDEVERILPDLSRETIARQSWDENGLIIIVNKIEEAPDIVNTLAPEHLEIILEHAEPIIAQIRHAGAMFLGHYTTEAIGDYMAGPSHVLPTAATARFSSGLSVYDFLKRTSIIECTEASFKALADATEKLAEAEGLTAHALAVSLRKQQI